MTTATETRIPFFAVYTDDIGPAAQIAADGMTPVRGAGVCLTREAAEARGAVYVARGPMMQRSGRKVPRAFRITDGTMSVSDLGA